MLAFTALTSQSFGQPPSAGSGTTPVKGPAMGTAPAGMQMPNLIDMRMKMFKDRLDLTDDQSAKVRGILEADQKVAVANREKFKDNKEAAMKDREQRRQETDNKIRALLTKDQLPKYDKMMEEFRQNHPGGPGMGKPKDTETKPNTSNNAGSKGEQGSGK